MTNLCDNCKNGYKIRGTGYSAKYHCCTRKEEVFAHWGTVDEDYRIRRLTPRECERLQGFPDDWTRYGKDDELISDTQRYKCIGNAVTTNVITAIVDEMFDKLLEGDDE